MATPRSDALVSTDWLAARLGAPDVKLADATYFLPTMRRDAAQEYRAAHIQGAVFFDIDDIADADDPLPHMLPDAAKFSSRVRRLGLGAKRIVRISRRIDECGRGRISRGSAKVHGRIGGPQFERVRRRLDHFRAARLSGIAQDG